MDEGHGRSFSVDLNENEDGGGGCGQKGGLQERSAAPPAGVGKTRVDATVSGSRVDRDPPGAEPPHRTGRWVHTRGTPGVCGEHGGLNGVTESVGEDEASVAGLEGEGEGGGGGGGGGGRERGKGEGGERGEGGGGGGGGLSGSGDASRPAALPCPQMRQQPAGEPQEESPDCGGISLPHQRNCACTDADVNMPNGGVDGGHTPAVFPRALLAHRLGPSRVQPERDEVKLANGGLHIVTAARATRDPDGSPGDNSDIYFDLLPRPERGAGLGFCARAQSDGRGQLVSRCAEEDAPPAAELLHFCSEDPPGPGSRATFSSPCPSAPSNRNGDSPLSEPNTGDEEEEEDEEEFSDLSLPVRPHSLRTHPNLAVSLSCDATPLSPDGDGGFYFGCEGHEEDLRTVLEAGRRQSAPDTLPDLAPHTDSSDPKLMPKRFGIADFFTRSLFSRKSKEPKAVSNNATGWRLFGKTTAREGDPAKESTNKQCPQEEEVMDSGVSSCPQQLLAAGRRKNLEFEPLSTTALILEDRPANLPAKSVEETQRHKLEYEEMVAGAKRRELREAQKKKRQMKERHRQEDSISKAMVIWNNEILPHWDTVKGTRRVRELWWQGLPPSVRGRVWSLAIGNELNITPELYEIFLSRAKEKWRSYSETSSVNDSESDGGASLADRESSLDLIKLDISRTFPPLFIFQKGGPYHDLLHSVLGAYTCYRPDIGYVQGMSFIAAVLILNLEEAEAFITFANLLNKPCQMAFFRVDHELMLKYFAAFEVFFEENLPHLFSHFQTNNLTPDLYLIDWIFTLYSKSLPLDVACRVWDVFCRDGEESLFRTGLGILRLYEDVLLQMDFIHIAQFLTRLPEDLQPHTLFNAMANTHMTSKNGRWAQVFSALMKDGNKETDKNSSPALRS